VSDVIHRFNLLREQLCARRPTGDAPSVPSLPSTRVGGERERQGEGVAAELVGCMVPTELERTVAAAEYYRSHATAVLDGL
jgi:hypothetical protein